MLIEHLVFFEGIENPRVLGSIPSPGTTSSENPDYGWVFAFLHPNLYQPNSLIQPLKVRSALPLSPFLSPASSV